MDKKNKGGKGLNSSFRSNQRRGSGNLDKVWLVPQKVFFTKGIGRHKAKLQSFELALRDARIEKCKIDTGGDPFKLQ